MSRLPGAIVTLLLCGGVAPAQAPARPDAKAVDRTSELLRATFAPLAGATNGACQGHWVCELFDKESVDPADRHEGRFAAIWRDEVILTARDDLRTLDHAGTVLMAADGRWIPSDGPAGCPLTPRRLAPFLADAKATHHEPITFADRPALRIGTRLAAPQIARLLDGIDVDSAWLARYLETLQNLAAADARKRVTNVQADIVAVIDPAMRQLLQVRLRLLCLSDVPTDPDRRDTDPIRYRDGMPEPLQRPWLSFLIELAPDPKPALTWPDLDDDTRARLGVQPTGR